tara:strand:+ start:4071 stop:4319 length:249 start_codon:yes stop_codon:yes gene_type:complete
MKNCPISIASGADQDQFLQFMFDNLVAYHPDEDAHDYVIYKTGERVFDDHQASMVNRLTEEALSFDCNAFWSKAFNLQKSYN